ncbi:MAG: tetratricopeptide repeat protein [bacterium]
MKKSKLFITILIGGSFLFCIFSIIGCQEKIVLKNGNNNKYLSIEKIKNEGKIEQAYKLDPKNPEILLELGKVYNMNGDKILHYNDEATKEGRKGKKYKDDAQRIFKEIMKNSPEFADNAQYYLGASYCDSQTVYDNNYHQAIQEFMALIQVYPKSKFCPKAQYGIGKCFENLKNYENAIEEYKKVIEKYPQSEEKILAYRSIGWCYVWIKNYKNALTYLQEIVDNFPKTEHARSALLDIAEIYKNNFKNYNKAIEVYREYLHDYAKTTIEVETYQEEINTLKAKLKNE